MESNAVYWSLPCERLSGVIRKSPTANGWVLANGIKNNSARANVARGFMLSRCATKHGQRQPRKGRSSEACLGKSQTTEEPTLKWYAVEVCGFGVPLPRSNLLAARVSKKRCSRANVGGLGLVRKQFLHIGRKQSSARCVPVHSGQAVIASAALGCRAFEIESPPYE